jgi:hypothetical protein
MCIVCQKHMYGDTLLMISIIQNKPPMFINALRHGRVPCNINKQTQSGNTALHIACFFERPYFVNELLKMGADHMIENALSETPLSTAVAKNNIGIVDQLVTLPHKDYNRCVFLSVMVTDVNLKLVGLLLDFYENKPMTNTYKVYLSEYNRHVRKDSTGVVTYVLQELAIRCNILDTTIHQKIQKCTDRSLNFPIMDKSFEECRSLIDVGVMRLSEREWIRLIFEGYDIDVSICYKYDPAQVMWIVLNDIPNIIRICCPSQSKISDLKMNCIEKIIYHSPIVKTSAILWHYLLHNASYSDMKKLLLRYNVPIRSLPNTKRKRKLCTDILTNELIPYLDNDTISVIYEYI